MSADPTAFPCDDYDDYDDSFPGPMRAIDDQPCRVLLVEDSTDYARLVAAALARRGPDSGFEVDRAVRLDTALGRLRDEHYDAMLLDLSLPDAVGEQTLRGAAHLTGEIPVVVLTGEESAHMALEAGRLGVTEYLVKRRVDHRALPTALLRAIRAHGRRRGAQWLDDRLTIGGRVDRRHDAVAVMRWPFVDTGAMVDEVTFCDRLTHTLADAERRPRSFAVVMVRPDDLDVLDEIGPPDVRAEVYEAVAHRLEARVHHADTIARMSDEGFAILLDWVPSPERLDQAIRSLLDSISEIHVRHRSGLEVVGVSASFGVAMCPRDGNDLETLVENAELAREYAWKSGGRRVCLFGEL